MQNSDLLQSQVEETKQLADGEKGNAGKVTIWRKEIEFAKEYEKCWKREAEIYVKDYENEEQASMHIWENPEYIQPKRYNVFWANTQTLKPLLFSKLPDPNITQNFFDNDEIARLASEMMERSVSVCLKHTDAEDEFEKARDDYLVTGRGVVRVVYEPEEIIELEETEIIFEEDGTEREQPKIDVDSSKKSIRIEFVRYDQILTSTENEWKNLRWIGFRHLMSKEQLVERFGAQKASRVDLTATIDLATDITKKDESVSIFKRAVVWEIWDKESKKVHWVTESGEEVLLESIDDPYQLKGFFPCPKFLGLDAGLRNILPIPLYRMYRSQAQELNDIDRRLHSLTGQLKFTGIYKSSAESQDIENLFNGDDGKISPAKAMMNVDDIKKGIMFKPIIEIAATIDKLEQRKALVINNIREITGLSDIVRGVSAPTETATAQELKGDFAISRIQPLQKNVENFIRDSVRLIAELIVENYDIVELSKMTNLKIVDLEEIAKTTGEKQKQLMEEAVSLLDKKDPEFLQKMQELQAQAQAGFQRTMKKAQNDLKGFAATPDQLREIDRMIKDDKLRGFTISIETDATIKVDQNQEKQDRIEFVGALSNFAGAMFPLVQSGILSEDAFNKFLLFTASPFKVARNIQELLIKDADEDEQKQPDPEMIKQQREMQKDQQEIAFKEKELQVYYELGKEKNSIEKAKVIKDMQQFEDNLEFEDVNREADRQAKTAQDVIKQRTEILSQQIKNFGKGENK